MAFSFTSSNMTEHMIIERDDGVTVKVLVDMIEEYYKNKNTMIDRCRYILQLSYLIDDYIEFPHCSCSIYKKLFGNYFKEWLNTPSVIRTAIVEM